MAEIAEGSQLESKSEFQGDPKRFVRRWSLEVKLALKREKDWRNNAKEVYERYKQKNSKGFNILWSNTEVLHPNIYNSLPKPDVRRRFRDADPLGKAVSQVIERALDFLEESTNADAVYKGAALHVVLPGRAVAWHRYVPSIMQEQSQPEGTPMDNDGGIESEAHEILAWEQVERELVGWDDFIHGPGKTWAEVTWVGRRHKMTRDELVKKFGDIGKEVPLDDANDSDIEKLTDKELKDLFKTTTIWEIWDKEESQSFFMCERYKAGPLQWKQDPLNLRGFFPCQEPIHFIMDPESMVPTTHFSMYEKQAKELDAITERINEIIKSIRADGIYDSRITELATLFENHENDLIPAENLAGLLAALKGGGLEQVIWMRPIESHVKVYAELITQRAQLKQEIYELTGLSDIVRGSTNASETATAQSLKSQWGSLRLDRVKKEFQRWVRDGIRISAEIISQQFSVETLMNMTGLKYPTGEEKAQAQQLLAQAQQEQQQAQMAQQAGMPPTPPTISPEAVQQAQEIADTPSWDEIMEVLHSDPSREFRIDIETDSTVADSIDRDMSGLKDVLTGLVQFWQGAGPAVQAQAIPIEVVKEISLSIVRRAKLGLAVEDALEKMKQPAPQDQSQAAAAEAEHAKKVEEIKSQTEIHKAQKQAETTIQVEGIKAKAQERIEAEKARRQVESAAIESQNNAANVERNVQQMLQMHSQQMQQTLQQLTQVPGNEQAAQGLQDAYQQILAQVAQELGNLRKAVVAPRLMQRDEMGRAHMSVVDPKYLN